MTLHASIAAVSSRTLSSPLLLALAAWGIATFSPACTAHRAGLDPSPATSAAVVAPPLVSQPASASSSSAPIARDSAAPPVAGPARSAGAATSADALAPTAPASPCPPEMANVGRFCVDRWEDHLVVDDGNGERAWPYYQRPPEAQSYRARSEAGVFPQAYISRLEADQACRNARKRLCTVVEWYRACRGQRETRYPYGPQLDRKKCNHYKAHLLSRLFGSNPRNWTYKEFNDPQLDREPGFLARSGEYAACESSYGVFDMVGNLHEWVSDKVDSSLPNKVPLEQGVHKKLKRNFGHGVFMGGFYSTTAEHGPGCEFTTIGHEPQYHDYSTGFRCCADARDSAGN